MHRARPGFTMLELAIVMTMMGLLTAMALPKVRAGKAGADLRAARAATASYANQARRLAIARGAPVRLRLNNPSANKVVLSLDDGTIVAGPIDLKTQWGVTLTAATKSGTNVSVVRFDKHGLARDIGTETRIIRLQSATGKLDSVCISGAGMIMRGTCR